MPLENKGQGSTARVKAGSKQLAGGGDAGTIYNPPFARNILNLSSPLGIPTVKLQRGKLWREFSDDGHFYALHFLYNPSALNLTHSLSSDAQFAPTPLQSRNPDDKTTFILPMGSSAQFSLLFDRTYELANKGAAGTSRGNKGVEDDIASLYYITGQKNYKSGDNRLITSPPVPNTIFALFGGPDSLKFYGYISSLNITYSHWTQFMVPVRATVAINMTLFTYSPGGQAKATAGGTG